MKLLNYSMAMVLWASSGFAAIQSASNIVGHQVALNVKSDEGEQKTLIVLNLKSMAKEKIALPSLDNEEVMGLVLFPDNILMISQWTSGDGKNPQVHEYNFKNKKWSKPVEIPCLSFDKVEVKASEISVQCETGGFKSARLSFKVDKPVKLVLPLQTEKKGEFQYKLSGGSMFHWNTIDFQEGKKAKKSLTSKDLLATK